MFAHRDSSSLPAARHARRYALSKCVIVRVRMSSLELLVTVSFLPASVPRESQLTAWPGAWPGARSDLWTGTALGTTTWGASPGIVCGVLPASVWARVRRTTSPRRTSLHPLPFHPLRDTFEVAEQPEMSYVPERPAGTVERSADRGQRPGTSRGLCGTFRGPRATSRNVLRIWVTSRNVPERPVSSLPPATTHWSAPRCRATVRAWVRSVVLAGTLVLRDPPVALLLGTLVTLPTLLYVGEQGIPFGYRTGRCAAVPVPEEMGSDRRVAKDNGSMVVRAAGRSHLPLPGPARMAGKDVCNLGAQATRGLASPLATSRW